MSELLTGTVKFYNGTKGYGFVIEEQTKAEYFFHIKDMLVKKVDTNDIVTFELVDGRDNKSKAINVNLK